MIRDVGLALAMGDTPLGVMAANLGKVSSNQNGGWEDAAGRDLHIGAWNVESYLQQRLCQLPVLQ